MFDTRMGGGALASLDVVSVDVGGFVIGVVVTAVVPMVVYLVRQYVDTQRVKAEMGELRRRVEAAHAELQEARNHLAELPIRLARIETMLDVVATDAMRSKVVRDACGYRRAHRPAEVRLAGDHASEQGEGM